MELDAVEIAAIHQDELLKQLVQAGEGGLAVPVFNLLAQPGLQLGIGGAGEGGGGGVQLVLLALLDVVAHGELTLVALPELVVAVPVFVAVDHRTVQEEGKLLNLIWSIHLNLGNEKSNFCELLHGGGVQRDGLSEMALVDRPHGEGPRHCAGAVFLLPDDRYGDVDEAYGAGVDIGLTQLVGGFGGKDQIFGALALRLVVGLEKFAEFPVGQKLLPYSALRGV